nr:adenosylcobinamide-GDP ribazoletransferase [Paraglaciecola sp. 20A4]
MLAVSFFTRLPVHQDVNYSSQKLHQAGRHFALIGWLLAAILSGFYLLVIPYIGIAPSICLLVILSLLLTGALHEDGLADTCDGFWGAHTQTGKLSIMKDSQIGTYGTCALITMLLTKTVLLYTLAVNGHLILGLFIAYPLSRGLALSHTQHLGYARTSAGYSKSQSLASAMQPTALLWLFISSSAALLWLPFTDALMIVLAGLSLRYVMKCWFKVHIGGYTGDCLGFAQQVQELLIYLLLLVSVHDDSVLSPLEAISL